MYDQAKHAIDRLAQKDAPDSTNTLRHNQPPRNGYMPPPEVNRTLAQAEQLIRDGDRAEAQTLLKQMRHYAEKNPRYWQTVLKSARNRQQARAALRRIINLKPRSQEAWRLLERVDPVAAETLADQMHYRLNGTKPRSQKQRRRRTDRLLGFAFVAFVFLALFGGALVLVLTAL